MDIIKIYAERADHNVQDGISRPLGSWEIHKTKAGTVLRDTLYSCQQGVFFFLPSCEPRQCQPDFLWYFIEEDF